jgi:hypothetical protein
MKKIHEIKKVEFEGDLLKLVVEGQLYQVPVAEASERLANASVAERNFFRISPAGFGIHWPEIDEDLSIDGLIALTKIYKSADHSPSVLREEKNK